jgi:hypothetical protein
MDDFDLDFIALFCFFFGNEGYFLFNLDMKFLDAKLF